MLAVLFLMLASLNPKSTSCVDAIIGLQSGQWNRIREGFSAPTVSVASSDPLSGEYSFNVGYTDNTRPRGKHHRLFFSPMGNSFLKTKYGEVLDWESDELGEDIAGSGRVLSLRIDKPRVYRIFAAQDWCGTPVEAQYSEVGASTNADGMPIFVYPPNLTPELFASGFSVSAFYDKQKNIEGRNAAVLSIVSKVSDNLDDINISFDGKTANVTPSTAGAVSEYIEQLSRNGEISASKFMYAGLQFIGIAIRPASGTYQKLIEVKYSTINGVSKRSISVLGGSWVTDIAQSVKSYITENTVDAFALSMYQFGNSIEHGQILLNSIRDWESNGDEGGLGPDGIETIIATSNQQKTTFAETIEIQKKQEADLFRQGYSRVEMQMDDFLSKALKNTPKANQYILAATSGLDLYYVKPGDDRLILIQRRTQNLLGEDSKRLTGGLFEYAELDEGILQAIMNSGLWIRYGGSDITLSKHYDIAYNPRSEWCVRLYKKSPGGLVSMVGEKVGYEDTRLPLFRADAGYTYTQNSSGVRTHEKKLEDWKNVHDEIFPASNLSQMKVSSSPYLSQEINSLAVTAISELGGVESNLLTRY